LRGIQFDLPNRAYASIREMLDYDLSPAGGTRSAITGFAINRQGEVPFDGSSRRRAASSAFAASLDTDGVFAPI